MEGNLRREIPIGEEVTLDKGRSTECRVNVLSQTKGKLFSEVQGVKSKGAWSTMTTRLTRDPEVLQQRHEAGIEYCDEHPLVSYGIKSTELGYSGELP